MLGDYDDDDNDDASSLASSSVWEGMVVKKWNKYDNHGVSCGMLLSGPRADLFAFFVIGKQGGFPIHSQNLTLIRPYYWMAILAIHTNTPTPCCGCYVHILSPLLQGIIVEHPVSRPAFETLFLYLCSSTLESTGGISM